MNTLLILVMATMKETEQLSYSKKIGINGQIEYTWSNFSEEKLMQFYYQLVRTESINHQYDLMNILNELITTFKTKEKGIMEDIHSLAYLYKLIGYTRDIIKGKGERTLTYMQIYVWYHHFPKLAEYAIKSLVYFLTPEGNVNNKEHQYGSWNDIKYFCSTMYNLTQDYYHPLINYALSLITNQLLVDKTMMNINRPISLAAKHTPKEKSKYNWMFNRIAYNIFPYETTCSCRKLRKEFLSPLNNYLKTTEHLMCENRWDEIEFNKVSSQSLRKHKGAWTKHCHLNYNYYLDQVTHNNEKIKGSNCQIYELVKDAMNAKNQQDIDLVNLQWRDFQQSIICFKNMLALCDNSEMMLQDNAIHYYTAIGLSILISEKTSVAFKDRVLVFNNEPHWVNLKECKTFYDKVKKMTVVVKGGQSKFYKTIELLIKALNEARISSRDIEKMIIVVLSDMQITNTNKFNTYNKHNTHNTHNNHNTHNTHKHNTHNTHNNHKHNNLLDTMTNTIDIYFKDAFMKTPHFLLWNLRKTDGFPCRSSNNNITLYSGYNAKMLNYFTSNGLSSLKYQTPYIMLQDMLSNRRYKSLERYIYNYFIPLK
uniref:Uncharacterized protein n=1 Tax=viral metagenome TaxID=1070528 RepID=A0A6C0KIU4_9ZZZZ